MNMGMANMNLSSNPFGAAAPVQPQPTMASNPFAGMAAAPSQPVPAQNRNQQPVNLLD